MSRKLTLVPPIDPIERDFLDALDRLEAGAPLNSALAKRAKLGTLKINMSSVAQEAGHSRTLIGHDGCKYPQVRGKVTGFKTPLTEGATAEDVIRRLREENAELRKKLVLRDTESAALIVRLRQLETSTRREIKQIKRNAGRSDARPEQLAGSSFSPETGDVIHIPTPKDQ
jgi:hypothetical protein